MGAERGGEGNGKIRNRSPHPAGIPIPHASRRFSEDRPHLHEGRLRLAGTAGVRVIVTANDANRTILRTDTLERPPERVPATRAGAALYREPRMEHDRDSSRSCGASTETVWRRRLGGG